MYNLQIIYPAARWFSFVLSVGFLLFQRPQFACSVFLLSYKEMNNFSYLYESFPIWANLILYCQFHNENLRINANALFYSMAVYFAVNGIIPVITFYGYLLVVECHIPAIFRWRTLLIIISFSEFYHKKILNSVNPVHRTYDILFKCLQDCIFVVDINFFFTCWSFIVQADLFHTSHIDGLLSSSNGIHIIKM